MSSQAPVEKITQEISNLDLSSTKNNNKDEGKSKFYKAS